MAEALTHHLGVFTGRQHERRHRMPQSVEWNPWNAVVVKQSIERLSHPPRCERQADFRCEYQVEIVPQSTDIAALLILYDSVSLQCGQKLQSRPQRQPEAMAVERGQQSRRLGGVECPRRRRRNAGPVHRLRGVDWDRLPLHGMRSARCSTL